MADEQQTTPNVPDSAPETKAAPDKDTSFERAIAMFRGQSPDKEEAKTPVVETPVTPVVETPPAADPNADIKAKTQAAVDRLAAQERDRQESKSAAKREAARADALDKELAALKKKLKDTPVEALAEVGWDADNFIQGAVGGKKPEDVRITQLAQELDRLKNELVQRDERDVTKSQEAQVSTYKKDLADGLSKAESEFAFSIAVLGGPDKLAEAIFAQQVQIHHNSNGEQWLSAQDVATEIEAGLRERVKRVSGQVSAAAEPKKQETPVSSKPNRTITPDLNAGNAVVPEVGSYDPDEDDEARLLRATAILKSIPKQ